jgi:hypothetical protein
MSKHRTPPAAQSSRVLNWRLDVEFEGMCRCVSVVVRQRVQTELASPPWLAMRSARW